MDKKCIKCGKRRGTRNCKPLGGYICSQCCGENRGVRINCPSDCAYFHNHEKYQEKKLAIENEKCYLKRYAHYTNEGKRNSAELMGFIEFRIYQYYKNKTNTTDEDILADLNFLRQKASPIFIPQMSRLSRGEYLWKDVEEFLKGKENAGEMFSSQEIVEVIENIIKFVSSFKHKKGSKRGYIRFLNGYMRETEKETLENSPKNG
ncbi:MAG: hypothetical protein U9O41_10380 [Candidatus Aerophobetes bacterium]|nr:hypothetical protein [Candidatus Aerophobetes bacterium]